MKMIFGSKPDEKDPKKKDIRKPPFKVWIS